MFPNCLTHPAAKADSVSVLVSKEELANSSMALATHCIVRVFDFHVPADVPFERRGHCSSKSHCNQNWLSSPPPLGVIDAVEVEFPRATQKSS